MSKVKQRTPVTDLVAEGEVAIVYQTKSQIHKIPMRGVTPQSVNPRIAADVLKILKKADASLGDTISVSELDVLSRYRTAGDAEVALELASAARLRTQIVDSALTVRAVAGLLGVNGSRIRQRLADHSIYGVKRDNKWRIPKWQFDDKGLLPGIDEFNRHIDHDVDVVELHGFLHSPNVDLVVNGERISPLVWLQAGLDAEPVGQIAATL
ncbi:MAG: hypothetical protein U9N79_02750 [Actinomycetota bacterium]|nr:hypothetical protein [Actinomycetota bacterium]